MARGKGTVKIKKTSLASKDDTETLNKMFEQMTGTQNAEIDVIIPKFLKIHKRIAKYHKLFNILLGFNDFVELVSEYPVWLEEIKEFINKLVESTKTDLTKNYDEDSIEQISVLKQYSSDEFNSIYKNLKDNSYIHTVIITGSNLSQYKKALANYSNLDDSFIKREPGLVLQPLAFSGLDLKLMWGLDNITVHAKKYILSILNHAYNLGIELYDIITSPDIDINKFSEILIESISKLRKQIPRCDKAFDVIENSVKLLENNFKTYYRSSVEAENPSIISHKPI